MTIPLQSRNNSRDITVTRSSESINKKPAPRPLPSHLLGRCKETMVLGGFYSFFHRSFAMRRSHRSISPVTGGATSPSAPWDEHQEARNALLCGHFLHTQSSLLPICTGTVVIYIPRAHCCSAVGSVPASKVDLPARPVKVRSYR